MSEVSGIGALGLDLRALIFQVVNFAILLWLLKKFALRPIVKILEERRLKIAESLASAHAIEQAKANLAQEQQRLRAEARQQAQAIIDASKVQGQEIVAKAKTAAAASAQALLTSAQGQLEQQVQDVRQQLKAETLSLVATATEKLIGEKLDSDKDQALIRKALHESV